MQLTLSNIMRDTDYPEAIIQSISHDNIIHGLLQRIEPVDFQALNGGKKPSVKNVKVIAIDEFIKAARQENWDIVYSGTQVYLYNGQYWKPFDNKAIPNILGMAAEAMGIAHADAMAADFVKGLTDQFYVSAFKLKAKGETKKPTVNLKNGTLVIDRGNIALKAFNKEDFLTYQLPFDYTPNADCPMFRQYLEDVLPDEEKQHVLQDFIASIFIPKTVLKFDQTLVLYGQGSNGKSVFADIITSLFGSENVSSYGMDTLCSPQYYTRANLANVLLNFSSEFSGKLDNGIFKQLSSGEPVEVREIYKGTYVMSDYGKLAFNCNQLPKDVEQTDGFFRRFLIVEFDQTISGEKVDHSLAHKIIKAELPGVLNWVLEGLRRVLKNGKLSNCEAAKKSLEEYRKESDSVLSWMEEMEFSPTKEATTLLKTAFENYQSYCRDAGCYPVNNKTFSKRLKASGFRIEHGRNGNYIFGAMGGEDRTF